MNEPEDKEASKEFPSPLHFDPALAELVDIINSLGKTEVGVTVTVGGSAISGMLVSARRYFELVSGEIRTATKGIPDKEAGAEGLASFFDYWAEEYLKQEQELSSTEEAEREYTPPSHIHLRSAQMYSPGLGEPLPAVYWRGRLSEISGWSISNFGSIEPLPD